MKYLFRDIVAIFLIKKKAYHHDKLFFCCYLKFEEKLKIQFI